MEGEKRVLPVPLSPEERARQCETVTCLTLELEDLMAEQKEAKAQMKAELDELKKRLAEATAVYRAGTVDRPVAITVVENLETMTVDSFRADDGRQIGSREMTPDERARAFKSAEVADLTSDVGVEELDKRLEAHGLALRPSVQELKTLGKRNRGQIVRWLDRGSGDPPASIRKWVQASELRAELAELGLLGRWDDILGWQGREVAAVRQWIQVIHNAGEHGELSWTERSQTQKEQALPPRLKRWVVWPQEAAAA